jgi:CBS domain-containing protein
MHARVKDIMTTHVVAVRSDASYREMIAALRARRVSGLPVVDDEGTVVGVVSETDLLTKRATAAPTAADLMTRPVVTTSPDELVSGVALVGIVCRSDVLSVFSRPDDDIRREITQDVILDGFFTDPDRLTVTVKDGIVTLEGAPGSVVLGRGIVDQARHVEGVVAVRDRFTYPVADHASSRS